MTVATRKQRPAAEKIKADVVVGKDVLELLSTAMYVDPLSVVREYVQNAVDAIDQAYSAGLLKGARKGRIEIRLDPQARTLRVSDNGIGVRNRVAVRTLCAFGNSPKRGAGLRGFRGVGRLAGLGYARAVCFRTKGPSDAKAVELRWDCRRLRSLLHDQTSPDRLSDVVREVVSVRKYDSAEKHFFEVELEGVIRIGQDSLLNEDVVERYLRQVVPLPFDTDFRYSAAISEFLAEHVPAPAAEIFLNDSPTPLARPHSNAFAISPVRNDEFSDLEFVRLYDGSKLIAGGWVLHHGYLGALKGAPEIRGLRARLGDMQIGHSRVFESAFPESRFNSWSVGELHILDDRIVPNARRDDFEPTGAFFNLLNQLAPLGRDLSRRCRISSQIRNRVRAFDFKAERLHATMTLWNRVRLAREHHVRRCAAYPVRSRN